MVNWPKRDRASGDSSNENPKDADPVKEKNIERLLM